MGTLIDWHFTINCQCTKKANENQEVTVKHNKMKNKIIILIVEDDENNYLYIYTLLEDFELNLKTLHAKNGNEAVEICKNNNQIDLILMDLKLPDMDGLEATKQIRKFRPNLPIIAQTSYLSADYKEKAISTGCNDFILKPFSDEILYQIITKHIDI